MTASDPSSIYQQFLSYDFDADLNFQAGLPGAIALHSLKSESEKLQLLEKAKWFYYCKFVEPFDYNGFLMWKKAGNFENISGSKSESSEHIYSSDKQMQANTDTVAVEEESNPPYPLSFQRICEMIQNGEEIPGVRQIPNTLHDVTNASVALMNPKPKPWERH